MDVRGGGPGTRETEALAPENLIDARMPWCWPAVRFSGSRRRTALPPPSRRGALDSPEARLPAIPIVPAAVLHDLGNGGDKSWGVDPPYRALGLKALAAASADFSLGSVGAGRGAMAGLIKGGVGSASIDLGAGLVVGALVALNSIGSALMPDGKTYWAWPFELDGEFGGAQPPAAPLRIVDPAPDESRLNALGRLQPGANTTLGVVACSAALTNAECKRIAMMAQDGIARGGAPRTHPLRWRYGIRSGRRRHRSRRSDPTSGTGGPHRIRGRGLCGTRHCARGISFPLTTW